MIDDDLITLQIKVAYLEKSVDELNAVITSQTLQLQTLQAQLKLLYRYLDRHHDEAIAPFDLLADRPPHY